MSVPDLPRRVPAHAWRAWVAHCTLFAVTWASLGSFPWIVAACWTDAGHVAMVAAHEHETAHGHGHRHDAFAIPGSPTHPLDHDCAPCETLKALAGGAPPPVAYAPAVLPVQPAPAQSVAPVWILPRVAAALPPARAPPHTLA